MGVTNIWHVMNLSSSPFFQDPLAPGEKAYHPISLFVGREDDLRYVLDGIGSDRHTRHVIQGRPGVGKTTLVQFIKASAAEDGYLADADAVEVTSAATADQLRMKILISAYNALVAHNPALANHPQMQEIRQLLGVGRGRSFNVSLGLPGIGSAGAGSGVQRQTGPGALEVKPERLLRELSDLVVDLEGIAGIIIHLNNLENLADAQQREAARVLRDLRDTGLRYPGLHYLIVGTDEAIQAVITAEERLRSIMSNPGSLRPLRLDEVEEVLERRYQHLRIFDDQPLHRPVSPEGLHLVHSVFRGNLRGLLQALDEASRHLIGRGDDPAAAMKPEELGPVLTSIYQRKLETELDAEQQARIRLIAEHGGGLDGRVTAKQMEEPFGLKYTATNNALSDLVRKGYVEEDPETAQSTGGGRPSRQFRLTGTGRMALGELRGG